MQLQVGDHNKKAPGVRRKNDSKHPVASIRIDQ